jgi:Domain of unknown function (DUF4114)
VSRVTDIEPGAGSSLPSNLTEFNNTLYFNASSKKDGLKTWKIDSASGNPILAEAFAPNFALNTEKININGVLYFVDPQFPGNLWKIDTATNNGLPVQVTDYDTTRIFIVRDLQNVNGTLYYTAVDDAFSSSDLPPSASLSGRKLWKIDSSTGKGVLVDFLTPANRPSEPTILGYENGKVYISAYNGVDGNELWEIIPSNNATPPVIPNTPPVIPSTPPVIPSTPPVIPSTPPVIPSTPPVIPSTPSNLIPGITLDKNLFNFISPVQGFGIKAQSQKPGSKVNEIVMLALDNAAGSINGLTLTSPGYFAAAFDRAKTIFSTLGGDFFDTSVREISIDPGKFYQFIEIQDASLFDVKQQITNGIIPTNILYSLDSQSSPIKVSENSTKNGYQVSINNDELVLDILPLSGSAPSQPLGSNIQNTQAAENRLIDLTAYAGQTLKVDLKTKSSAAYNNNIGFYAVEDTAGTIKLGDGTLLTTDKANYAVEAVKQAVLSATKSESKLDQNITGGKIYAPVLISQGTLDSFIANNPTNSGGGNTIHAYFNYVGANPDKVDHFRLIGNNTFGVEDLYGGGDRDFNDLVINLNIKTT